MKWAPTICLVLSHFFPIGHSGPTVKSSPSPFTRGRQGACSGLGGERGQGAPPPPGNLALMFSWRSRKELHQSPAPGSHPARLMFPNRREQTGNKGSVSRVTLPAASVTQTGRGCRWGPD